MVRFVSWWGCEFLQADQAGNNAIAVVRMTNVTGKIPKAPSAMDEDEDDSDSESSDDEEEEADLAGAPDQPTQSKKPIFKVRSHF